MSAQTGINPRPHQGRLALVTGGSRGIGEAVCENLARKGCNLMIGYTSSSSTPKCKELIDHLTKQHQIVAVPAQVDLNDAECGKKIIAIAKDKFGSGKDLKIDYIINNAGVAGVQALKDCHPDDFHKMYNVNVLAPLMILQAAEPYLPRDRSGRIVNVSSVSASLGTMGQAIYGGTKGALEAMTRTWSRELCERCTVNAINPGPVGTDMYGSVSPEFEAQLKPHLQHTPLSVPTKEIEGEQVYNQMTPKGGRPATAEEIAGVICMLVSEESFWCTGSVICANGGMRMSP